MGWDNPPVPWREFERRLSWGKPGDSDSEAADDAAADDDAAGGEAGGDIVAGRRIEPEPDEEVIPWAELHCHSSYSFLDGASDPDSLIKAAAALGLSAIAITDHDGMYGVPQFAQA